ncbi:DUF2239 family protein [Zoogloea sp. LCSB751]|uniref:DUF2239 family protein n=1 Tax=Zoogloea sp. LCSB751 TaxID=1965277 RepID=UPI0009A52BC6|nr:DUF2239 family protein [Zoogloea sp. LCSB751]
MSSSRPTTYTTFDGPQRIAGGSLQDNALAAKRALEADGSGTVLTFDDSTGRLVDIDLRGSDAEVLARLLLSTAPATSEPEPSLEARGRGRPRLGVVAREVTLLPRHWDWLTSQPGGASVTLRKLVDEARRASSGQDVRRQAQERAYHFMSALAGDLPGFEETARALFADDRAAFMQRTDTWPADLRNHALHLAFDDEA